MGLGERAHHTPNQLSGGQQQRVAIARALVNDPELILADEPTGNLDSRTSVEIMEILQRLNRESGITILLITHEHDIAEYATRVVTVRDGRVRSDEPVDEPPRRGGGARWRCRPSRPRPEEDEMDIRETFRVALRAIRRNKVRSALTMLGVIIGVASVIAMIALGSGARAAIDEQIQSQGTTLIYLSSGSFGGPGRAHQGSGSVQTLTIEDAEAIAREIPTIARWTPGVRGRAQVIAGNNNWNTQVEGGNEDFLAVRNWVIADGANFTARDVLVAEKVCLLGATVARTLFPDGDPVGQIIRVRNMPFRVTGRARAPRARASGARTRTTSCSRPGPRSRRSCSGSPTSTRSRSPASSSELVEPTAVAITRLMRARHRIQNPEDDDFSVRTVEEMAATRVQMAETMTGLLMSVASVSLLVGGIGIMNIMLVSVTERTREIGVRMAVGAKTRDILRQFLAEAVALSLVGGLAGILLGVAVSRDDHPQPGLADGDHHGLDRDRVRLLGRGGHLLRLLPRAQGRQPRPDRGPALRVTY